MNKREKNLIKIRKAVKEDLPRIAESYEEHFDCENKHGAFTVFIRGIYPTETHALRALKSGSLYVCVLDGEFAGSAIMNSVQPPEYRSINWKYCAKDSQVTVLHLLLVAPSFKGRGVGSAFLRFAADYCRECGGKALRLDTGAQNIPAVSLYMNFGFEIAAESGMQVGGEIEHGRHLFLEKKID